MNPNPIKNLHAKFFNTPAPASIQSLSDIRLYLIDSAFSICLLIAIPASFFSLSRAYDIGWHHVLFLHFFLSVTAMLLWAKRRRLSQTIKGLFIVTSCFLLGVSGLAAWGLIGLGIILCMTFCILSGLFFGSRYGYIATGSVVLIMSLLAAGFHFHVLDFDFDLAIYAVSAYAWILAIVGTGFLCSLVIFSFERLVGLLFTSISSMQQNTIDLKKSNDLLETEIRLRRESDAALNESKERYFAFLDSLPEMVFEMRAFKPALSNADEKALMSLLEDLKTIARDTPMEILDKYIHSILPFMDGSIVFANKTILNVLGYEAREIEKLKLTDFLSPSQFKIAMQNLLFFLSGRQPTTCEYNLIKKSGETVLISPSITIENYKFPFIVRGVLTDITRQRTLEHNLYQSQRRESIGTLAGGIAHDFRNILTAILGYAEMARLDQLTPGHPAQYNIQQIIKASKRADSLIKHILTFSRQTEPKCSPIQIGPVIEEAIAFLQASLPTTIEIKLDIHSVSKYVMADPTQIYQVVINLCTNAAHAMRDTSGVLQITLEEKVFSDGFTTPHPGLLPGAYMMLTVADNGIGMSEEIMRTIFDPYFTTKEQEEGTGLGLAVVQGIVKSHKGEITVDSNPGTGSVFRVFFPVIADCQVQSELKSEETQYGKEHILFVDDDEAIADLVKKMLSYLGYSATIMTSSTEALELLKTDSDRFSLVITDLTMPKLTGIQLARRIKSENLPVILCTGNGYVNMIPEETLFEAGIRAVILKPLLINDLGDVIQNVLAGRTRTTPDPVRFIH